MAWIIAPALAGLFASIIFLITKYAVLVRQNPVLKGLFLVPVYSAVTASLIAMLLVWKGGSYEVNLTDAQIPIVIVLVGVGFGLLVATFFVPWLYRVVIKQDWQLRWYHMYQGPWLLRRGSVPPPPGSYSGPVQDYYKGHATREELDSQRADLESRDTHASRPEKDLAVPPVSEERKSLVGAKPDGTWYSGQMMFWYLKWVLFHGVDQDVVGHQAGHGSDGALSKNLDDMHARAARYDNRAEYLYSFLQIMTAATASFTHGANDVSKFVLPAPLLGASVDTSTVPLAHMLPSSRFGGMAGYQGTTKLRCQRGFCRSLCKIPGCDLRLTVLASLEALASSSASGRTDTTSCATSAIRLPFTRHLEASRWSWAVPSPSSWRLGCVGPSLGRNPTPDKTVACCADSCSLALPVSTTQCITGATVGVGLCNGDWRTINWRMVAWIYMGWFITLPSAALISGSLMGFILNAPRWVSM
jgi:phosphate/sulfate permease